MHKNSNSNWLKIENVRNCNLAFEECSLNKYVPSLACQKNLSTNILDDFQALASEFDWLNYSPGFEKKLNSPTAHQL